MSMKLIIFYTTQPAVYIGVDLVLFEMLKLAGYQGWVKTYFQEHFFWSYVFSKFKIKVVDIKWI